MKLGFNCAVSTQDQANFNVLSGSLAEIKAYRGSHGVLPTTQGANLAARNNHMDILKYLHKHGVDADSMGAIVAAEKGYLEVVRFLMSVGVGMFRVSDAALSCGREDIVDMLSATCHIVPSRRGLIMAKKNRHDAVAERVARKYDLPVPSVLPRTNVVFSEW